MRTPGPATLVGGGHPGHSLQGVGGGSGRPMLFRRSAHAASHSSARITAHFNSTLKSPVCHHPLKVFVRNCKILRLMLFGTNIAINIDIPCKASIILIVLLAGTLDIILFFPLLILRQALQLIFKDFQKLLITQ